MKRIIREVITLIRIERWLVKEDETANPTGIDEPERIIEESIVETHEGEDGDLRVIAQRVLETRQWEVRPNKKGRSKRTSNKPKAPKTIE